MGGGGVGWGAEAWGAGQLTNPHQKNRPQEEIEICFMHASAFAGWLREEWRGYITLAASGVITGSIGIGFLEVQNVMPPKTTGQQKCALRAPCVGTFSRASLSMATLLVVILLAGRPRWRWARSLLDVQCNWLVDGVSK